MLATLFCFPLTHLALYAGTLTEPVPVIEPAPALALIEIPIAEYGSTLDGWVRAPWAPAQELSSGGSEIRETPSTDIGFYFTDQTIADVEFEDDFGLFGGPTIVADVDRTRFGPRFGFGKESRGVVHIFSEEFGDPDAGGLDMIGLGGGVQAAPRLNDEFEEVAYLLPWRFDFAVAAGSSAQDFLDDDMLYFELIAELGFGIEWMGVRPSAGVTADNFFGIITDGADDDTEVTFFNVAPYAEIRYRHPDTPIYALFRSTFGVLEAAEFAVGFEF